LSLGPEGGGISFLIKKVGQIPCELGKDGGCRGKKEGRTFFNTLKGMAACYLRGREFRGGQKGGEHLCFEFKEGDELPHMRRAASAIGEKER